MASQSFKIMEHTADTGFEVTGSSRTDVFRAAAEALCQIMWKIKEKKPGSPVNLEINGVDLQELLVNFLEEFLYLYDAKGLICTRVDIDSITDQKLTGTAWLQPFDNELDQENLGVKAITYHQLFIGRQNDNWLVRVFLDI
jgi:SHS2 domain-containing protein